MITRTTKPLANSNQPKGKAMKRRLFATLLTAACAVAPIGFAPIAPAQAQGIISPSSEVVLSVGRGELVTVPGAMSDIFVANDAIADVQVKSQRQLYIFGKSGGQTTVYASNAMGDIIWSANIRVGSNIDSIDQMLALAMPEAKISVATMGTNTVLLTGTVAAPEDAAEAERLVAAFVGDGANVVSRMKMATPLQVNLQVRFAEVSRSLVRSFGGSLTSIDPGSGFQFGIGTGRQLAEGAYTVGGPLGVGNNIQNPTGVINGEDIEGPGIPLAGGTTLGAAGELLGLDLLGALDIAERNGLVTTLSQPNLTALSGETADFLAGGEFPIPISQGLGTTAIEYRRFGVSLSYTPTVLANGRISMRVRPEVSELSAQGAVTLNGFQVPSLTIRRAETTIELGSGQSFMIAGLMSNNAQTNIDKAPGLGDLPILGNLFKSQEFRKGETELVIVVTPYLVKPVSNPNDIRLPTDGFRAPSMLQSLLLNAESDGVSGAERPGPRSAVRQEAPEIGALQPGEVPQQPADKRKDRPADRRAAATLPTPGFDIK